MGKTKGAVGAMTTGDNPGLVPPKKAAGKLSKPKAAKSRIKAARAKPR